MIISTHPDNISYTNSWPEMAGDAEGNTYVVWQGSDGNDNEVYWVKVDAEGTPGQVQKISTHPEGESYDDQYPQIAVDSSGNSCVTWFGSDGNDTEIYWVKVDAEGTPGQVQKISTHPENTIYGDWNPQIAVDGSGNSYVTWEGSDGNDRDIYWVKVDASGDLGEVLKVSDHPDNMQHDDLDPRIAVDASGNSYVVWHGCDKENCEEKPGDFEIYWVRIDSEGVPGTTRKVPPTNPDNINIMAMVPQLAVDMQGNSCIVWSGINEESNDIYWVKIDTSGKLGTILRISARPNSSYGDYHPRICVDASGNSYVTWCGSEGKYADVYWVRIDSEGTPGIVQKISNYLFSERHADSDSRIAVDSSGNSYVTWNSCNVESGERFDQKICWVKIDTEGKPGRVQNISTYPTSKHFDGNSQIAVDSKGNSYVIWEGKDASKHDHIYFTACLSNQGLSTSLTIVITLVIVTITAIVVVIKRKKSEISSRSIRQNNIQNLQGK